MRIFRFAPRVYLENFDVDSLLLVADRDRLLTVNAAAAELFAEAVRDFGSAPFTLEQGIAWLAGHYELSAQQCRTKVCELLAFGLKHGLVGRADEYRKSDD